MAGFARPVRVGDVVVELTCPCGTQLVLAAAVQSWSCSNCRHLGTAGAEHVITADGTVPKTAAA